MVDETEYKRRCGVLTAVLVKERTALLKAREEANAALSYLHGVASGIGVYVSAEDTPREVARACVLAYEDLYRLKSTAEEGAAEERKLRLQAQERARECDDNHQRTWEERNALSSGAVGLRDAMRAAIEDLNGDHSGAAILRLATALEGPEEVTATLTSVNADLAIDTVISGDPMALSQMVLVGCLWCGFRRLGCEPDVGQKCPRCSAGEL